MDSLNSNKKTVEAIRILCKEKGTSLTKLEAAIGFGNGTIGKWASAPKIPPHDKLEKVRIALDVPLEQLLGQICNEGNYYSLYRRNRIFATMFKCGLSLEQLAEKTDIEKETIRSFALIEKTENMRECLTEVADALSVNETYLMGFWNIPDVGADSDLYPENDEWKSCNDDPYKAYSLHQANVFERATELGIALEEESEKEKTEEARLLITGRKGHGKTRTLTFSISESQRFAERYSKLDTYGKAAVQAVMGEEEARIKEQAKLDLILTKPAPKIIPLYLVPAAAGYASPIYGSDYENYELTPEDPQGAMFAIKIQGDSMEPHFPDGSIAFCNKDPIADGDVGVFCLDGESYIKQYHYDRFMGMTYLFSLNRDRADLDKLITSSSGQYLACMGRVITRRQYPLPR